MPLTFALRGDQRVTQSTNAGHTFDPADWGLFKGPNGLRHAVRIPGPFRVGPDHCADGYLVYDGKSLRAIGAETFSRDYEPAGHVTGTRSE